MYKDVWKKFGVKALIVVCSVLLIGGVAIAAPRLRAAAPVKGVDRISLNDVYFDQDTAAGYPQSTANAISGAAFRVTNTPTTYSLGSSGANTPEPQLQIEFTQSGAQGTWSLDKGGSDWVLSVDNLTNHQDALNEIKNAGTHRVGIKAGAASGTFLPGATRYFQFEVQKAAAGNVTAYDTIASSSGNYADTSNIKVRIDGVDVPASDYTVTAQPKSFVKEQNIADSEKVLLTAGKGKKVYINLRNFTHNGRDYTEYDFDITKQIKDLNPKVTYSGGKTIVEIMDITYPLVENTDYIVSSQSSTDANGDPVIIVTINGMGNYQGSWVSDPIPVTQGPEQVVSLDWTPPAGKDGVPGTYDYDKDMSGETYRISDDWINEVWFANDPTKRYGQGQFQVVDWRIVDSMDSSTANILKGRTAGMVRLKLKLNTGEVGYIYYNMKQDLSKANITIQPYETSEKTPFIYNGKLQSVYPVITFKDMRGETSAPLTIKEDNADFSVHYWLDKNGTGEQINKNPQDPEEKKKARTYAGTVYMDINSKQTYGYYGTLDASGFGNDGLHYTVLPQEVKEENGTGILELGSKEYSQTITEEKLLKDAKIFRVDKTDNTKYQVNPNDPGTTISWIYTNTDTNQEIASGWTKLPIGHYKLECSIKGNYEGLISTTFEISQYSKITGSVNGTCADDGTTTHEYNKRQHKPDTTITVRDKDGVPSTLTPGTDYKVRYEDNINVERDANGEPIANAKAHIRLNGSTTDDYTLMFTISPRIIKTIGNSSVGDKLTLDGATGFKQDNGVWTYEYKGKNGRPVPDKLKYEITYKGQPDYLELEKGKDYTVETESGDPSVGRLYDVDGNPISLTGNLDTTEEYYFKIYPIGNFAADNDDFVLAGPFKYSKRSLRDNEKDFKCSFNPESLPYANRDDSLADIKTWIENHLTLKDNGVSPAEDLVATGTNAQISIAIDPADDKRTTEGTIEFTITGSGSNYKDSIKGKLNVGRNIAESWVGEYTNLGTAWNQFANNELTLSGTEYAATGPADDPYDLKFGNTSGYGTNLYYPDQSGDVLSVDKNGAPKGHYIIGQYGTADANNVVSVTLQGVNGYYGKVTIKINVKKKDFNNKDYEIEFLEEVTYDGQEHKPQFQVKYTDPVTGTVTVLPATCYDHNTVKWGKNTNASEQYDEKYKESQWAWVEIEGSHGYGKTLKGYFPIKQRPLDALDANGNSTGSMDTSCFAFEKGGNVYSLPNIPYVPTTDIGDGTVQNVVPGAWQIISLFFTSPRNSSSTVQLGANDFEFYCTRDLPTVGNIDAAGNDSNARTAPQVGDAWAVIKAKKNSNYKGVIIQKYEVTKVIIEDKEFSVIFKNKWQRFTGEQLHPSFDVVQYPGGDKTKDWKYKLVEGTDYEVEYGDDIFVSNNYKNDAGNGTYVIIKGINNYGTFGQTGMRANYVIYGRLTKDMNPFVSASNAYVAYNGYPSIGSTPSAGDEYRAVVTYNEDLRLMYESLKLRFEQKRAGRAYGETGSDTLTDGTVADRSRTTPITILVPPATEGECTVRANSQKSVGQGIVTIVGQGNEIDTGLFSGSVDIPVTITASLTGLTDQTPGLWDNNNGSNSIAVTGSAITATSLQDALASALKTINFGGRLLYYGVDYEFSPDSFTSADLAIGENKKLVIIPSAKAQQEGYLTEEAVISYNLTSSISGVTPGVKIESDYIYAHGNALVDSKWDFKITVNGANLSNPYDYTVTIKDKNGEVVEKATDCGDYTYVIEGKGSYSGRLPQGEFTIHPYDLGANKDKVDVVLKKTHVTYTGSIVLPEVEDVILSIGNNIDKKLNDPNFNGGNNYGVRKGAGDNSIYTNWTDTSIADVQKPVVEIYGIGNYTGVVEKDYLIEQKDIASDDITVEDILGLEYNNNEPIKPYPDIRYIERAANPDGGDDIINILLTLQGEEYNSDKANSYKNWIQDGIHFTYQYLDDVHTAGSKRITIRGVGNFKGSREKTYEVGKLKLANTKLSFLSEESPVYDGTEQKPAFKLSYGSIDIMTFMNGTVSSNFIGSSNVSCTFTNNIEASTENVKASVTVKIVGDSDNYEGEITAYFSVLPAPLENHVRFMYRPAGSNADVDLSSYKLNLPFLGVGSPQYPGYADTERELAEGEIGMYYNHPQKANHGKFLIPGENYYNNLQADENGFKIEYKYVEPDTDDTDIREEYRRDTPDYAGKVKVTITGKGNYAGSASFWYFIGEDISTDAKISISPTTAVFNAQKQYPEVKITGVDKNKCKIGNYRGEVAVENLIQPDDFINASTYYIRVEGDPTKGTYATKPETLKYTITPRAFSNSLVIDGFKREYSYTGYDICPVGISVTDYIDRTKYKLTEDVDYTLTYKNNLNAGTAYINIKGQNNFSGSATANFLITSSTISSGGTNGSNSFLDQGIGEISGATAVSPSNVNMSMDTIDAMYYTGKPLYPKVSIAGMTENIDYTVTFSNNVEVGTAVATVTGIGNNKGTITKNFRIIAQLSKCTISPIPAQQYTGSEVKPSLTVKCGNSILMEGTDYTVTYSNNIHIGTATATLRALNNANYTGTASVKFSIGNDVGGFIISGYAPSYAYTGKAITPGVVVETGSRTLTPGTDYTVSYSNNVNAGTAIITVTGVGKYSGKQTANFVIEPKSIQSCDTTDVQDRTYTGDAYTPDVTVSDGGKVLTKGVDYTVTYTNNTNPGMASILIKGTSSNYSGTKVVSFKISAVAVKGLKASNVKYNSLKLKWTKQGYADGYQICDSKSKVIKTLKTNSATITGLTAGKTYKYKVRSYIRNADGTKSYGAFSSVLNATTKLRTPKVKVVSNAKGQARISWSKVSGASGYEIYYKKSSGAKYKKLKTVNNPNIRVCTVRGMKSGDRAYFRIRAFRKNGSKKVYSSLNPLKVITVK